MQKIHVVLHTHWDREWYFTTSDSLVLMQRTFKNVINELEKNNNISFCLDGQYSIIEEFLSIQPEFEAQVLKLVKEKRLFIGPWYTQTDSQLIASESMMKNLYYGMYKTRQRFGSVLEVGYLPDTFGFCNQLPEILKTANIDKAIFWRGSTYRNTDLVPYFNWVSLGNNSVKTINLVGGYGMAKGMNDDDDFIKMTLNSILDKFSDLGIENEILIPVGNDQFEILENSEQVAASISNKTGIDIGVTNYEDAIDELFKVERPSYQMEFRGTEHTRIHKSIGSVRYHVKKSNYDAEVYLLNRVEPLVLMASRLDVEIPVQMIYNAWALLFEGQAHDGICGCISDDVALDLVNRNKRSLEIAKSVENLVLKELSNKMNLQTDEVLLVNASYLDKQIMSVDLFSEFPAIEITDYDFEIVKTEIIEARKNALVETPTGNFYEDLDQQYIHSVDIKIAMEPLSFQVVKYSECPIVDKLIFRNENSIGLNEKITFHNGCLNFVKGNHIIEDFISITNCGNDGDTYDFSPLRGDKVLNAKFVDCYVEKFKTQETMNLTAIINIPRTLEDRINGTNLVEVKFNLLISYVEEQFRFTLMFDNTTYSHKVAIGIKTGILGCKNSIASTAYGVAKRMILNGMVEKDWEQYNVEMPVDIETFDGFVKLDTEFEQFSVLATHGKEYQVSGDTIYLTALCTTSQLGKPDLLYRPGRASGDVTKKGHVLIATPLAESIGNVEFSFGLVYGNNDVFTDYHNLAKYRSESIFYQNQEINKFYNRIDNKILPYGAIVPIQKGFKLCDLDTNAIITNVALDLTGNEIIRGFTCDDHYLNCDTEYQYVDLFGNDVAAPTGAFQIFNIKIGG